MHASAEHQNGKIHKHHRRYNNSLAIILWATKKKQNSLFSKFHVVVDRGIRISTRNALEWEKHIDGCAGKNNTNNNMDMERGIDIRVKQQQHRHIEKRIDASKYYD